MLLTITKNHIFPLTRALRLDTFEGKPIIAIVGGGGKTTAMFMLASELAAQEGVL